MWQEAGLSWKDFLPADQDVNKFVTEKVSRVAAQRGRPVGAVPWGPSRRGPVLLALARTNPPLCCRTWSSRWARRWRQRAH